VADSGLDSEANLRTVNAAEVAWVSRVPETSAVAQAVAREDPPAWQHSDDRQRWWWSRTQELPQGRERWLVVRSLRRRTARPRHAAAAGHA
jgi:hypothetical protein